MKLFFPNAGALRQFVIAVCAITVQNYVFWPNATVPFYINPKHFVYVGSISVGYTLGWSAPAIPKLEDPTASPLSAPISDTAKSFVGSIIYLGGLPGPYVTGYLSNVKGRKPCMLLGGMTTLTAYVILASAQNLVMLYVGRFLAGFGNGVITVMALVYLGEIASTNVRGIYLTGIGIFITSGSLLGFSVGPFVSYSGSAYVGVALAVAYVLCLLLIPETPIFYALKDQDDDVKRVLEDLGRMEEVEKVLLGKKEFEDANSFRDWKELVAFKGNRKALIITVILNIAQHTSGLLAVTFFATTIFKLAGSSVDPKLATIIIGCTQLFGGLLTPIFIERSGRRILLMASTLICCLSMFALGIYFFLDHVKHPVVDDIKWLPLASLVVFYIGFDAGLGIIPNALAGEMFEPNVRSKGCAVAISISWLFGFIITTAFGALVNVVGGHVWFWFFSGVCGFTFLYTLFFVPETKGKSLLEIQEMLSN